MLITYLLVKYLKLDILCSKIQVNRQIVAARTGLNINEDRASI